MWEAVFAQGQSLKTTACVVLIVVKQLHLIPAAAVPFLLLSLRLFSVCYKQSMLFQSPLHCVDQSSFVFPCQIK